MTEPPRGGGGNTFNVANLLIVNVRSWEVAGAPIQGCCVTFTNLDRYARSCRWFLA